jgi:hypothetical protein
MPFTFGNAFDRFFRLLGGNFVPFAIIGLIFTVLPATALVYIEFTYLGISQGDPTWIQKLSTFTPQLWAIAVVGWLAMVLLSLMSVSAITEVAILRSVDKRVDYGAVIGQAFKNAVPLFVVQLLVGLLVGAGFFLLIVPGIIWALCTCVAVPAYVGQTSIGITGAIGKSFQLTRNHRWALLFLFIVMMVIAMVVTGALSAATFALPGGMLALPSILVRGFIGGIVSVFGHVLAASVYVSLRESKEKTSPDVAAAVFE